MYKYTYNESVRARKIRRIDVILCMRNIQARKERLTILPIAFAHYCLLS